MYVIRDVFQTKPGKAKELVAIFKKALPHMVTAGAQNQKIMTDSVASYWTVVLETEVEELSTYFNLSENTTARESMTGYMDLVKSGHREIFKVE